MMSSNVSSNDVVSDIRENDDVGENGDVKIDVLTTNNVEGPNQGELSRKEVCDDNTEDKDDIIKKQQRVDRERGKEQVEQVVMAGVTASAPRRSRIFTRRKDEEKSRLLQLVTPSSSISATNNSRLASIRSSIENNGTSAEAAAYVGRCKRNSLDENDETTGEAATYVRRCNMKNDASSKQTSSRIRRPRRTKKNLPSSDDQISKTKTTDTSKDDHNNNNANPESRQTSTETATTTIASSITDIESQNKGAYQEESVGHEEVLPGAYASKDDFDDSNQFSSTRSIHQQHEYYDAVDNKDEKNIAIGIVEHTLSAELVVAHPCDPDDEGDGKYKMPIPHCPITAAMTIMANPDAGPDDVIMDGRFTKKGLITCVCCCVFLFILLIIVIAIVVGLVVVKTAT